MQGNQVVARIKSIAAAKGVPLETLYVDCKVSSSAVSQWKSGTTKPSLASIQRIAEYLDVSPSYLLYGSDSGLRLPTIDDYSARQEKKEPASVSADGIRERVANLPPELQELFLRFVQLALKSPEKASRYLAFVCQELESDQ